MRPASTRPTTFARCGTRAAIADEDILLLEGDVVFDRDIVMRLRDQIGNSMAVAPDSPNFSGTVVHHDTDGVVTSFVLGVELRARAGEMNPVDASGDAAHKTVNIYLLRGGGAEEHDPARALSSDRRGQRAGVLRVGVPRSRRQRLARGPCCRRCVDQPVVRARRSSRPRDRRVHVHEPRPSVRLHPVTARVVLALRRRWTTPTSTTCIFRRPPCSTTCATSSPR